MLFLDNAAPDSCCAKRQLHIPTYPRLASTAATVREKTCGETHKPNDPIDPIRETDRLDYYVRTCTYDSPAPIKYIGIYVNM